MLDEWQSESRLRFKTAQSVCSAVREVLDVDAHQLHAAVDLSCSESAQLMYELLLRIVEGYRPSLRSWEGDFHQLTRLWTAHGVGNSESMDGRAFADSFGRLSDCLSLSTRFVDRQLF